MVESPVVESKVEAEDMKIDDNPAITDDNSAKTMKKRSTSVRFEDLIDDEKGEEPMTSSSTTEQTNQENSSGEASHDPRCGEENIFISSENV